MPSKPKRIVVVNRKLCKPNACGLYLCQRVCPVNRSKKECITVSEIDNKPLIDEELCIGCGICTKKCPEAALDVVNLPTQPGNPVHRYGRNMFVLYRLPVPKKQSVTGLIGQNGIGKTTVFSILSGSIKPNIGVFERSVDWKEIIERFKGSELQSYFEGLSKNGIKSAYKPQHVDLIPNQYKGKAGKFLEKLASKAEVERVLKRLWIESIYNKNIANLSGGELQMLAIAATFLKKAAFYFFDEPSSYLDVEQRLVMAKEIRKLSEKAVVMVIEHDLAIADYLADTVHILYGKQGVFGIVSKPYGVREGINAYLEGYVKDDNVRFRDDSIFFEKRARMSTKKEIFLTFPPFTKKFPGFQLSTEGGELHKGEVIGIVGPNAIGKTTFIKMLIGESDSKNVESKSNVEQRSTLFHQKMKLSYKPQQLTLKKAEEDLTIGSYIGFGKESKHLSMALGLERLREHKLGSLSGGELQAVFIAKALLIPHDILLLDEPSAFLDVEQRLRASKLIRSHIEMNEKACFVVDHDLQFLDAVADRLMVFEGERGVRGFGSSPMEMRAGMNRFLSKVGITFRRDPQTGRPRANKEGSQLDTKQKEDGEYFYQ